MSTKEGGFGLLNEVWLNIITAVTTALLVNVLTGFTFEILPISQIIVLFIACIMIGFHARKRSEGLSAIEKRIELEGLSGNENAGKRRGVINDEWTLRQAFLKRTSRTTLILIVISVGLLFYKGFKQRNEIKSEAIFLNETKRQLQELKASITAKDVQVNTKDSVTVNTRSNEIIK